MTKGERIVLLKAHGHDIIDRVVNMGYKRTWVYTILAKNLKYNGEVKSHFSNMNTVRQCEHAIHKLKLIELYCKKTTENKKAVYHKNIQTIKEVGKRNTARIEKRLSYRFRKLLKKLYTVINFTNSK